MIKAIESGLYYSGGIRSLSIPYENCTGNWFRVLILVLTVKISPNKRYNLVKKLKRKGCCRIEIAMRHIPQEDWENMEVELKYEDLLEMNIQIPSDVAEKLKAMEK